MITEEIRLPSVDDDDQRTVNRLLAQLRRKEPRNKLRQAYVDMKHVARLIGSVVPEPYKKAAKVLGWSGKAVDLLARRCVLERLIWPDGNLSELPYREIWEGNRFRHEVSQSAIPAALTNAVVFVVVTQGGVGEPPAVIHFKSALDATGDWNARKRGLDTLLSVTGRDEEGRVTGLALYCDGRTIIAEREPGGRWSADVSSHAWGVPAFAMPYRDRLDRPFGSSRITREVMELQDAAVRALMRLEAHSDIYAIPDVWLLGAHESLFKHADGRLKAAWEVLMGRIKGVPDADDQDNPRVDVRQFPAASPSPHLDVLNAYAKLFARATALPDSAVALSDLRNPVSADSYDASQYELIAEAEGATNGFSWPLRRAMILAMAMAEGIPAADIPPSWSTIDTRWRDPRFTSKSAQADAGLKILQALPWLAETEVALELLGLDRQQIERALADRRRAEARQTLGALTAAAELARADERLRALEEGRGGDA